MTLEDLYKRHIQLWSRQIRINDGYPISTGYVLPSLSKSHAEIEDKIDHAVDHWGNVFTWSMFQACHEFGQQASQRGAEFLDLSSIPLEVIDRRVRANLESENWAIERAQYQGLSSNKDMESTQGKMPGDFL
jgi:hypothetical protein